MNGYICFVPFSDEKIEVYAATSSEAQQKAQLIYQKMFPRRKVKSFHVSVYLAEKEVA